MKIAIVGPGALGCLLAGLLKLKTKEDVRLIDRSPERAKRIRSEGIVIDGINAASCAVDISANPEEVGPCDLVFICVKSYSTGDTCRYIKSLVSDKTFVLTLQNGIGNTQVLSDHFGAGRVIVGATNHGAILIKAGHVKYTGRGDTFIGAYDGKVSGAVKDASDLLTKCGFEAKISKDIDSVTWSKLIINAGINALTGITRLKNGMLIKHDGARQILRSSVQEAIDVIRHKGIKIIYDDPMQKVESVCKTTADNVSSMLQDVLNARRTEIDYINGVIARQGKALGIPTPVNEALVNMIKVIELNYSNRAKESLLC